MTPSGRCKPGSRWSKRCRSSSTAAGSPLQVRVGIATGLVVVGDLIGSGEAQERGVVGETPNLAARLQGIAEPGMVVIAEGTRKLIGKLFELSDLGAQEPQGHRGAGAGLGGAAGERGRKPVRGDARGRARSRWSGARRKSIC